MFIGRERELATLRKLYDKDSFQMPVIYGRRRVGKTALIGEFVRDLPCVFFTAVRDDARANLRNLSREIYRFEHPDADPALAPLYPDFQTAFEATFTLAKGKRVVFVIDELPYLAAADPATLSVLQAIIDRNQASSQLFLVLCGSSLSFMREQVLGEKSPLYGRRTAQIEVRPFDFFDARRFFPEMGSVDAACLYGAVGGVPLYLLQFDQGSTFEENVSEAFLDTSSILYEEPYNLLMQEVSRAARYNSCIEAIANGATANNEIATQAGLSSAEVAYYLKELQRIGLVVRELPVVNAGRKPVYRLADNLFRFWYRFVLPHRSAIERGMPQRALRHVNEGLPQYMGSVFEDICAQWLWRQNAAGSLPCEFDEIGRWWGNDPAKHEEAEIDIVCLDGRTTALVGECKWRNEKFPLSELDELTERAPLAGAKQDTLLYAFSKSGFTQGCVERASRDPRVCLVDFHDM